MKDDKLIAKIRLDILTYTDGLIGLDDICEHIIDLVRGSEWVSVEDELPEKRSGGTDPYVWYYFESTGVNYGQYSEEDNCFYGARGFLCGDVTEWMYAPPPPTNKGE